MSTTAVLAVVFFTSAGCSWAPESLPPPPQRVLSGPPRRPFGAFLEFSDPYANRHIVRGVAVSDEARWRWTGHLVELRFWLNEKRPHRFVAKVFIASETFQDTGPITITCSIDRRRLGQFRCDAPHEFTFTRDVPEEWLGTEAPTRVVLEADRVWTSPLDGAELGFLLKSAGFLPR